MASLLGAAGISPAWSADQREGSRKAVAGDTGNQFPQEDAVFLRYAQHWTLDPDGAVHRREHWRVKLRNNRPIDRFADPRITHIQAADKLVIHVAKSILPSGVELPVPAYAHNAAATDAVAGWPQYADWQDLIVSFSGIEPGVILELDYEVISPPGAMPWLDGDIRLTDHYPIVQRVIEVTVPRDRTLHHRLHGPSTGHVSFAERAHDDRRSYHWSASDLAGEPNEPLSPPWTSRSPWLTFSTCADSSAWAAALQGTVNRSAVADPSVKAFARQAVDFEQDPADQVRKLAEKLRTTFNFVESPLALRGMACRTAAEIHQANYGSAIESGALLLAAVRSLDLDATPVIGVDAEAWNEADSMPPTMSAFEGALVQVSVPDGSIIVHPRLGEIKSPGLWGRRWVVSSKQGRLDSLYVKSRGEKEESELRVTGKLMLGTEGRASGELQVRVTGLFLDPGSLKTADTQKAWASGIVSRLLAGFDVSGQSIETLSDDLLRATVAIATAEPLAKAGGRFVLRFGDGPVFLGALPLPLERSERSLNVRVGTRVREMVDIVVETPPGWKMPIVPASLDESKGPWGRTSQTVAATGKTLRLTRLVTIDKEELSPSEFGDLRKTINEIRANRRLVAAFQP